MVSTDVAATTRAAGGAFSGRASPTPSRTTPGSILFTGSVSAVSTGSGSSPLMPALDSRERSTRFYKAPSRLSHARSRLPAARALCRPCSRPRRRDCYRYVPCSDRYSEGCCPGVTGILEMAETYALTYLGFPCSRCKWLRTSNVQGEGAPTEIESAVRALRWRSRRQIAREVAGAIMSEWDRARQEFRYFSEAEMNECHGEKRDRELAGLLTGRSRESMLGRWPSPSSSLRTESRRHRITLGFWVPASVSLF